jgi:hypothetical protein
MSNDEFIKLILIAIVCPAALPLVLEEGEVENEKRY